MRAALVLALAACAPSPPPPVVPSPPPPVVPAPPPPKPAPAADAAPAEPAPKPDDALHILDRPLRPQPAPEIRGVVQATSAKNDMYVISVGANDGVLVNREFAVTRDDRAVAQIVIDKVFPNHASAHVRPGSAKDAIQAGDVVTSR